MMGAPDKEVGRYSDEVLHYVTLTKGFWLADTACTQEFWKVVTNDNPSYFKGAVDLPIEQVSWHDVQAFIQMLNQQHETECSLAN